MKDFFDHINPFTKWILDGAAMTTAITTFFSLVTSVASAVGALLSVAWLGLRLYDYIKYGRPALSKGE